MAEALRFERETCSRCYGSGEHSYCEMYGRTCFKCAGSGQMLTKRAAVARDWMNRQNLIQAKDILVGMRIKGCGWTLTVKTIDREEPGRSKSLRDGVWVENPPGLEIRGEKGGVNCPDDFEFQLILSREDQIELLRKAIDYQNSLTKAGTPRKIAVKTVQELRAILDARKPYADAIMAAVQSGDHDACAAAQKAMREAFPNGCYGFRIVEPRGT